MTRVVVTADLWVVPDEDEPQGFRFELVSAQGRWSVSDGWIRIDEVRASFELPNNLNEDTLRLRAITTLKEKQEQVLADAHRRVQQYQYEIDKLLALPAPSSVVEAMSQSDADVVDASFEEVADDDALPF